MTDSYGLLQELDEQIDAAADEVARSVVQFIEAAADGDPEALDFLTGKVMAAVSAMRVKAHLDVDPTEVAHVVYRTTSDPSGKYLDDGWYRVGEYEPLTWRVGEYEPTVR